VVGYGDEVSDGETGQADAKAIAAAKEILRDAVRKRRTARSTEQRKSHDEARFAHLSELLITRRPRRVAGYLSSGTEPDSLRLVAWCAAHEIEVLLPVLTDGAGAWLPAPAWAAYEGPDRLREGRSRILEPIADPRTGDALQRVDLMVVPGLAADPDGSRLGRGGGWYDRARARHATLETWLLLNDDEVLEAVPADDWDLPVDLLITPTRMITTASRP
jgi:5-formyltetrahydrofolate cyclo-ligase